MPEHYLSGEINDQGYLVQYSKFRYTSGYGQPSFQLSDWHHTAGMPDRYMRFGLRNGKGTQVSNTIQFDPGQGYTTKYFTKVGGGIISGSVALNVRSANYGTSGRTVKWNGRLILA